MNIKIQHKRNLDRIARIKFVSRNIRHLLKVDYFTPEELVFLMEVSCYTGYGDNLIFVGNLIASERYADNKLIILLNSLIRKGAILVDIKDETALTRPLIDHYIVNPAVHLHFNPEIAYNGRFSRVPKRLYDICRKYDFIEKSGVELPWRIRLNGKEWGYFCGR